MNSKRILYCTDILGLGGVERRRLSLCKYFIPKGCEIKIICSVTRRYLYKEFEDLGVEVIQVGTMRHPFDWKIHKKIQEVIIDFRPHIIHGAVFEGVSMAIINGAIKKVPIVIMEETSDPVNRSWLANRLIQLYSFSADSCVGVSQASVNYLENVARVNKRKIKLINNGVKPLRNVSLNEQKLLKQQLGIINNEFVVGSVGRMSDDSHKRFSDLIKAFNQLILKGYKMKLLLVGDGTIKSTYQQQVSELGIENHVIFAGYHEDSAKFYKIMDVFSLTSGYEAFGLVLAEAMFASLPIVATRVGGMKYIVDDKKTGFLVDRFDVDQISTAIEKIYLDPDLSKKFGKCGYEKVLLEYSEEVYTKKVKNLYLELFRQKLIP